MDMTCTVSKHKGWVKAKFTFGTPPEKETDYKHGDHTVHVVFESDVKADILGSIKPIQKRGAFITIATESAAFVGELNGD